MVPGAVMTLAAGVAFGFWGYPLVVFSATAAACLAFLIVRYIARERVEAVVAKKKTFVAGDKAIEERGWRVVGLMRLSPLVPLNLQNYLLGVTKVNFTSCALSTLVDIRARCCSYGSTPSEPRPATTQARASEPHSG